MFRLGKIRLVAQLGAFGGCDPPEIFFKSQTLSDMLFRVLYFLTIV